jgi:hypothetical protein
MFWIWENSLHYGPKSKIYEKIKNRFLRMSLILYLVSIQSNYVCVLGFREISKGLWYLSSSWRFLNISSDTFFWLLGRNYLIYLVNLFRKPLKTTSKPKYGTCGFGFQLEIWLVESLIPRSRTPKPLKILKPNSGFLLQMNRGRS